MRSTIRCVVCSTCLTLLVSPDSAGARVVSRRLVLFSFFSQNYRSNPSYISIRTYRYLSIWHLWCKNPSGWTASFHFMGTLDGGSIPRSLCLFSLWFIRRMFLCGGSALAAMTAASSGSLKDLHCHRHCRSAWPFAILHLFPCRLPPPSLSAQVLILLTSDRIREPQSTCTHPGVVLY